MKKQLLILTFMSLSILGYTQTVGDTFVDTYITYEITSISPNTVEAIDYNTAGGNVVNIPDTVPHNTNTYSVTSIGSEAFRLNQLISVTISGNVNTIKNTAFADNNNMTSATIQNGVVDIQNSAFFNCGLTSLSIPDSVISIGNQAFDYNDINSLSLGNSLNTIGFGAFRHNQLNNITIPSSVTSINTLAFDSNPLTSVTSLATVPPTIFTGTNDTFSTNRSTIDLFIPNATMGAYVTDAGALWTGFNSVTEASAVVGDTFIVDYITYRIISLAPNAVETLDYDVAGGTVVNIPATVSAGSETYNVTNIKNLSFHQKGLTDLTLLNSITFIGTSAFLDNNLTSVTIPTSITSIPSGVFAENLLTSITIPDNILEIGNAAFQENQLTTVVISNNATTIGGCSFCFNQLTEVTIPDSVVEIGNGAFASNMLTDITIPSNVTNIETNAFKDNPLTSVTSLALLPPSIQTSSAFPATTDSFRYDRSGINLIIPNGTTDEYVTDSGALWTGFKMVYEVIPTTTTLEVTDYDSSNGTSVTIPNTITTATDVFTVTEIGDAAFFDKGLTNVNLPNSVTSIGISSFNTNNLTSITIPGNVTIIGAQAFVTNDLTSITLGNNVSNIGIGAFADNDLTSVTFPNSVTEIGPVAFAANPLTSVISLATIPPTITTGTNDTFHVTGDRSNINLTIPNGTENDYIAAQWINFASVTLNITDFELANNIKVISTANAIKVISPDSVRLENYTIYNILGAKVATGNDTTIATSTYKKGIYIIKLDFDRGIITKKILIN